MLSKDLVVEGVLLGVLVDDDEVTSGAVVCVWLGVCVGVTVGLGPVIFIKIGMKAPGFVGRAIHDVELHVGACCSVMDSTGGPVAPELVFVAQGTLR